MNRSTWIERMRNVNATYLALLSGGLFERCLSKSRRASAFWPLFSTGTYHVVESVTSASGATVENLSECLCNDLAHHFYVTHRPSPSSLSLNVNVDGRCDDMITRAARRCFIDIPHMLAMFPQNLILELSENTVNAVNAVTGNVKAVYPAPSTNGNTGPISTRDVRVKNPSLHSAFSLASLTDSFRRARVRTHRRPRLRLVFVFSPSPHSMGVPKPHFEVSRQSDTMTSRAFAATRFGSTKLKTHQQCERGQHPFTMPSLYAYLQLLVFLNSVACAQVVKQEESVNVEMDDDMDSGLSASSFISSNNNLSSSCASDSLLDETESNEQLVKKKRPNRRFDSGDCTIVS
ncbi:hypothetical protein PRIPAC_79880 [Pristionchus pacificus]|uniref:Uncharacterized protein n=1 Tax=Pristionchus pacificus TaxID=54126 RepID=A0A2A6BI01_PRIPA|nr:hypothetical protein PRIPAC_79880 [Pristionchus pacificus]|eukprot:PDM65524.1 hypothetical protein PRIPAC_52466 [Pristionchus pacificus]